MIVQTTNNRILGPFVTLKLIIGNRYKQLSRKVAPKNKRGIPVQNQWTMFVSLFSAIDDKGK